MRAIEDRVTRIHFTGTENQIEQEKAVWVLLKQISYRLLLASILQLFLFKYRFRYFSFMAE